MVLVHHNINIKEGRFIIYIYIYCLIYSRSVSSNISEYDSSDTYSSVSFNSTTRNRSNSSQSYSSKKLKRTEKYQSRYEILPITYWSRTEECLEAKHKHIEKIDHLCESRERLVLYTTLYNRRVALEKNMFPCKVSCFFDLLSLDDTPYGIEHYTLWSRYDMSHEDICRYVDNWISRRMPHVRRWNYDDNAGDKSIELFHVHVYIETVPYAYQPKEAEKDH